MQLPTTQPTHRDIAWYVEECADLKKQLASEIEAKRKHLHIACEEINHLKVRAEFFERENAALREMIDLFFRIPYLTDEQLAELIQNCKSVRKEEKQ